MEQNRTKTKRNKGQGLIYLVGYAILVILVLGVCVVFSLDLDPKDQKVFVSTEREDMNVYLKEDFNSDYGAIRISKTSSWDEEDKIAEYTLIKNTEFCILNCEAEGKVMLFSDGILFDDIKFKTLSGKQTSIVSYEYLLFVGMIDNYIEVPATYKKVCEVNGTCYNVVDTYGFINSPIENWEKYNGEVLKSGNYRWKIKGKKQQGQSVDFIPMRNDVEFSEWAVWQDGFNTDLIAYYTMNDTGCSIHPEDHNLTSGTPSFTATGCKIGTCLDNSFMYLQSASLNDINLDDVEAWTACLWSEGDGAGSEGLWGADDQTGRTVDTAILGGGHFGGGSSWQFFNEGQSIGSQETVARDGWQFHCFVSNATGKTRFRDAVFKTTTTTTYNDDGIQSLIVGAYKNDGSLKWTGQVDELGIWNRELTQAEIVDLYNGGSGLTYVPTAALPLSITVTLISPTDASKTNVSSVQFFANITATNGNVSNLTLFLYNSTTLKMNSTTGYIWNNRTENWTMANLIDFIYTWNVFGCGLNNSNYVCQFATSNRTILVDTRPPTISLSSPSGTYYNNYNEGSNTSLNLAWTINDTFGYSTCSYTLDSYLPTFVNCLGSPVTITVPTGTHNLTFYSNDSVNNWNSTFTTFEVKNIINLNTVTYNTSAFETEYQNLKFNLSYDTSIINSLFATIVFNGTRTNLIQSGSGSPAIFEHLYDVQLINQENENKSFYLEIRSVNSTTSTYINTTIRNQTIRQIHLENCSQGQVNLSLNISVWIEENNTKIDPFSLFSSLNYWLGRGTIYRNVSFNDVSVSEKKICINPFYKSYIVSGLIHYEALNNLSFQPREYYFDLATFNNVTNNLRLYLLASADTTSFIIKVQDINQIAISGAYVYIDKYYPETDSYETVQVIKTDDNGKSIGFYQTETVLYRHRIVINGETVLTTSRQKIFGETVPYTLTFTVGVGVGTLWTNLQDLPDLSSGISFNRTTKIVTFTYVDTSNNFTSSRLKVDLLRGNNTNTNLCNLTSLISSNTLICNVSNHTGSVYASAYITRDLEEHLVQSGIYKIDESIFAELGLFLGFLIILIASSSFLYNETAGIWMTTLTIFFVNLLGLVNFGGVFVWSVIGIAIILTIIFNRK